MSITQSTKSGHSITGLTNPAAKMLREMLNAPGWTNGWADIAIAGGLLSAKIPEPALEPAEPMRVMATPEVIAKFKAEHDAWSNGTIADFAISDKERDCVRKALKHFAEKSAIPPSRHSLMLGEQFGMLD